MHVTRRPAAHYLTCTWTPHTLTQRCVSTKPLSYFLTVYMHQPPALQFPFKYR